MIFLAIVSLCFVSGSHRSTSTRRRYRPGNHGYGNETIIESERGGDQHFIRIVLPDGGFMTGDGRVDTDRGREETLDQNAGTDIYGLVQADQPLPPRNVRVYRMSGSIKRWTQAQVRWTPNTDCATGYRIRYISELTSEDSGDIEAISDTVRVGPVDWMDISAAGKIIAISIATECKKHYGPYSEAQEVQAASRHPDRIEIFDIRTRTPSILEMSVSCKLQGMKPGVRFLVMARRRQRNWQKKKQQPTKTWSLPGSNGPVFNLTGLRPRTTYGFEVRIEKYTPNGDRTGPWSATIEATTLHTRNDEHVLVQNSDAEMRMYGPPTNVSHSYHRDNRVSLYWRPPDGVGTCMAPPAVYRLTYGPLDDGNFLPERVRDLRVTMRLIPRGVFYLRRVHEKPYMFQITAVDRDSIPSLWASDLHLIPAKPRA